MNTPPQGPYSTASDLETTAEYPPLTPGAPMDTWIAPPRDESVAAQDPLRAHLEEIKALRQSVAGVTLVRDQLQAELSALTATRHELEELLLTRDTLLSKHERDLGAAQDEISKLREILAAVTTSRNQLQADLDAQEGQLKELQRPEGAEQAERVEQQRLIAARDQQLAELNEELAGRAQQHFLVTAERDDLQARLQRAKADLSAMAQRLQPSAAELARRNAALARNDDEMTQLQRRVAALREALQRAEAHRQVFESMLRDREEMIDERDARVGALTEQLEAQRREHRAALEQANAQPGADISRAGGGERQFAQQFDGIPAPAAETVRPTLPEVEPTVNEANAAPADPGAQAPSIELKEELRALRLQFEDERNANEALRGDLAAVELELHKVASELRQSNARLAQSDAVVGAATARFPRGQRLLVRTEGDAGIVHVLGRRTTIGRIAANDLCIDTDYISRRHAVVLVTDTETVVEDLNSTNGVFVNNLRVTRHTLREGDVLTIGKTNFRYVFKPEIGSATLPAP